MNFRNQALTLESDGLPSDSFVIAKLHGEERLSGLFRFELELLSTNPSIDLEAVLYSTVKLGIRVQLKASSGQVGSTVREVSGVFEQLEQLEEGQGLARYRAVLVPKAWQATRSHRSRIFQDKTVEGLVRAVLGKEDLAYDPKPDTASVLDPALDYEFRLSRDGGKEPGERAIYPQREYVVQYEESDWQFLSRWLEHEGIYFYFENDDGSEKLVFADTHSNYAKPIFGNTFAYRPESAGEGSDEAEFAGEQIRSFRCLQRRLPQQVSVRDYNWRVPSAKLHFHQDVHEHGTGVQTEYNDHFKSEAEGKALAQVRREELQCRAQVFHGSGSCRSFRAGQLFVLEDHFREDYNRGYVLTKVVHAAEQMISIESSAVTGVQYANTFEAVADDIDWRPARTSEWPAIKGVMHAKVDAEGDGQYAELDEHGRYKLKMPFDEHGDGMTDGKASRWVRMAQPYAGPNAGMHFPLLKGTEVLVTHIDGDPDRPVIAGAVPNVETESPVNGGTAKNNAICTSSGNVLQIDDNAASSGFFLRDAAASQVKDNRWRRAVSPPAPKPTDSPSGGRGMSEQPGSAFDEESDIADDVLASTTWGTVESTLEGWELFFKGTAFKDLTSWGKYLTPTDEKISDQAVEDTITAARLAETAGREAKVCYDAQDYDAWADKTNTARQRAEEASNAARGAREGHPWEAAKDVVQIAIDKWTDALQLAGSTLPPTNPSINTNPLDWPPTDFTPEALNGEPMTFTTDAPNTLQLETTSLTEENMVKLLNRLLANNKSVAAPDGDPSLTTSSDGTQEKNSELSGKAAQLIANTVRNLEAVAGGSSIDIELGDSIGMSVGNNFEFNDTSYEYCISMGGKSDEEVHGETTATSYQWGDATETSTIQGRSKTTTHQKGDSEEYTYVHGDSTVRECTFGWGNSWSYTEGGNTENSLSLGIFNSQSLFLGLKSENEICVSGGNTMCLALGPMANFEIGAFQLNVQLSKCMDVSIPDETEVRLSKVEITANNNRMSVAENNGRIMNNVTNIKKTEAAIDNTNACIKFNSARMASAMAALGHDLMALSNKELAANSTRQALVAANLNAFTSY